MSEDIKHSTAGHSSEQLYLRERPFEGDCLSLKNIFEVAIPCGRSCFVQAE